MYFHKIFLKNIKYFLLFIIYISFYFQIVFRKIYRAMQTLKNGSNDRNLININSEFHYFQYSNQINPLQFPQNINNNLFKKIEITNNVSNRDELNINLIVEEFVNNISNELTKIRILAELSSEFFNINKSGHYKIWKCGQEEFDIFRFLEKFSQKLAGLTGDICFLLLNIVPNFTHIANYFARSEGFKDCLYIFNLIKDKIQLSKLLTMITDILSYHVNQAEIFLYFNSIPVFKDILCDIIMNNKKHPVETLKNSLSIVRDILYHSKNAQNEDLYSETKKYFDLNNISLMIDDIMLKFNNEEITDICLLIEKENWSMIELYVMSEKIIK